ncbi:DNA cytosine methyltransferase [Gilliamella sp. wkB308]|uniref:DNA cytosine methyltransferase n=1 Tax=Gilliamella sp. wkB308 TaxID=3120263 RepID=UPI00080E43BF|nr:DNA cytosine methyltransferase [Gilliamella apicola]OCF98753.1 hypothetical protein A9G10_05885 [Gilliamella apicola]
MNVLSLFDGMSCGRVALERADIPVSKYYASEIDKYATQVSQNNYPDIIRLGDINNWENWDIPWSDIDLILAGSPCQGFSFAGKQLAFDDKRSALFFRFAEILAHVQSLNPDVSFLLENVRMKKEYENVITSIVGVEPVMINSALVSAQNRQRLYWCNWNVEQPADKKILLNSILQNLPDCPIGIRVRDKSKSLRVGGVNSPVGSRQEWDSPYQIISKKGDLKLNQDKSGCLTAGGHSGGNHSDMDVVHAPLSTRRYSTIECERLQTLPDNYTAGVSNTQRYKMLGNGWTVDVIAHILKHMNSIVI